MPIIGPVIGVAARAAAALGGRAALGKVAQVAKSPAAKIGAVGYMAGSAGRSASMQQGQMDGWFPGAGQGPGQG